MLQSYKFRFTSSAPATAILDDQWYEYFDSDGNPNSPLVCNPPAITNIVNPGNNGMDYFDVEPDRFTINWYGDYYYEIWDGSENPEVFTYGFTITHFNGVTETQENVEIMFGDCPTS